VEKLSLKLLWDFLERMRKFLIVLLSSFQCENKSCLREEEYFRTENVCAMVSWFPSFENLFSHCVKLVQHQDKG